MGSERNRFQPMDYEGLKNKIMNRGKRDNVRRFTVPRTQAYNMEKAKEKFLQWHDKYYPQDNVEILRIESQTVYLITYKIIDKQNPQQKLLHKEQFNEYIDCDNHD